MGQRMEDATAWGAIGIFQRHRRYRYSSVDTRSRRTSNVTALGGQPLVGANARGAPLLHEARSQCVVLD